MQPRSCCRRVTPRRALAKLADALAADPGNDDARYDYVKLLIEQGQLDEAEAALAPASSPRSRASCALKPCRNGSTRLSSRRPTRTASWTTGAI